MANQVQPWNDPKVRAARQPAAEAAMGRAMDLDPLPGAKGKKRKGKAKPATQQPVQEEGTT